MRHHFLLLLAAAAGSCMNASPVLGQTNSAESPPIEINTLNIVYAPAAVIVALDQRMPITKLAPAKIIPDLCKYKYRVTTSSPECQAFVDQSLGFYYSYVWMEAARSAETALRHDPECAYAWFLLSRALEKWARGDMTKPLTTAKELMPKAGHREQLLIQARLQEKGMWPGVGPDERKKKAAGSLDELLTIYGDDEEGLFARAQINGGTEGAVYYRALLRFNQFIRALRTSLFIFLRTTKDRPLAGRSPKPISHRRPAYHMRCTCRPIWACASANGAKRPIGHPMQWNWKERIIRR